MCIYAALPPVLTPPSEVQSHCTHVNWRNSPDVSCGDIIGYDVRLFDPDTGEEVIRREDARGTFHNFLLLDEDLVEKASTMVQVYLRVHAIIVIAIFVLAMQLVYYTVNFV